MFMKKIALFFIAVSWLFTCSLYAATVTINPTTDGFVRQSNDTYVGSFQNMELSSYTNLVREIFLDFDLTDIELVPENAVLRLHISDVSNANPAIIAAYAKTGNAIVEGLTFTNRPTTSQYKNADVNINQDSIGKWISFNFSDYIKTQDFSVNKLLYFRLVVVYPPNPTTLSPLIKISSIETSNKPQLILSSTPQTSIYEIPYAEFESYFVSVPYNAVGDPINAFNGAGLLPDMKHTTDADNLAWRNSSGTYPIRFMAKLKTPSHITKLHIWNFNWISSGTNYTNRGIKGVEIYVSSSPDNLTNVAFSDSRWKKISSDGFQLTQATGDANYGGQIVALSGADDSRWLAFNILSNFAGSNFVGLSEVKIYKSAIPTVAKEYTWNGASEDSWNNAAKWSPNRAAIYPNDILNFTGSGNQTINNVPAQTLDRLKVQSGNFIFKNTGTLNLTNLEVQAGAGAEFAPDASATVDISGNLTIDAAAQFTNRVNSTMSVQNMYLNSNSSGTATLINEGTVEVSGSTYVKQYLGTQRNWYISSPVAAATATAPESHLAHFFEYVEAGNNNPTGQPTGSTNFWKGLINNHTLEVGKGYIAKINTGTTIEFSGALNNNASYSIALSRTVAAGSFAGFNLVGNPYPAYLDWSAVIADNENVNIGTTFWFRTKNTSGAYTFSTHNGTSGLTVDGTANTEITKLIPPMQAFWVRVNDNTTSTNLTIKKTMLAHKDAVNNKLKAPGYSEHATLRLQISNGEHTDETLLYFNDNAHDDFDAYDSPKMFNNNKAIPEIYTRVGNQRLVINGMSYYDFSTRIPLGFVAGHNGSFSISASQLQNFDSDTQIYLTDNLTNSFFNLSEGQSYNFNSDAIVSEDRFTLLFKSASGTTTNQDVRLTGIVVSVDQGQIILHSNNSRMNQRVTVYNTTGRIIHKQQINEYTTVLNQLFDSGIYLVKVEYDGKVFAEKILVD